MEWVLLHIQEKTFLSPSQQPYFFLQPPPPPLSSSGPIGFNLNHKVSPSILLIIIILAIIFFISGLLHLLVRFLLRHPNRDTDEMENVTALQGQLQQLFHLHDAGVDQSFIDTLPVFNYKAIIGVKDPFDCAVCLCEFEAEDKLRLLPKCSHAFHMDCIDDWLLAHSTCPLCRASLLPDFSPNSNCSPFVLVLESGSGSSRREIVTERVVGLGGNIGNSVVRVNSLLNGEDFVDPVGKSGEIQEKVEERPNFVVGSGEKVVEVKLGKFRSVDGGGLGEGSSETSGNADARRCFSMGSLAYVMDDRLSLQVPIRTHLKKQSSKKPYNPGHRQAMSECGCDSRREFNFNGFDAFRILENQGNDGHSGNYGNENKGIERSNRESFSVSKIWLRGKKDKRNGECVEASRRAASFRFPVNRNPVGGDDLKQKNGGGDGGRRTVSEIDLRWWENGRSELGFDEEDQSCNSLDSHANAPSFARRTLLWLMGRQNKVVHSSGSVNL